MKYFRIDKNSEIDLQIDKVLKENGPVLCELNISEDVRIEPKAQAIKNADGTITSKPLNDMYPYLPVEEIDFNNNFFR